MPWGSGLKPEVSCMWKMLYDPVLVPDNWTMPSDSSNAAKWE